MPEFLKLLPPEEALNRFLDALGDTALMSAERIPTAQALDRVLAEDIIAPHDMPPFTRTTVDGYAVRAAETHGASASLPAYLRIIGEVSMGAQAEIKLQPHSAVLVHTGAMLPDGADAVIMLEDTDHAREGEVEIHRAAAVGDNVLNQGEDVRQGETVLDSGARLRPQEIGGLMGLGITEIAVRLKPAVGILSTGDEVVPPETSAGPGEVRDINTYTLSALVTRTGGDPVSHGIIPDRFEALLAAAREAHVRSDLVIITAGSSVSARDITADVITELGQPGVLVHGVTIRPGKPTILALAGSVPVIGLPGNPVSALVIAGLFVRPILQRLLGMTPPCINATIDARMSLNVASVAGREDYQAVRLVPDGEGFAAVPIFGRSNLIFTMIRADGLVRIPAQATGIAAGEHVQVIPLT